MIIRTDPLKAEELNRNAPDVVNPKALAPSTTVFFSDHAIIKERNQGWMVLAASLSLVLGVPFIFAGGLGFLMMGWGCWIFYKINNRTGLNVVRAVSVHDGQIKGYLSEPIQKGQTAPRLWPMWATSLEDVRLEIGPTRPFFGGMSGHDIDAYSDLFFLKNGRRYLVSRNKWTHDAMMARQHDLGQLIAQDVSARTSAAPVAAPAAAPSPASPEKGFSL